MAVLISDRRTRPRHPQRSKMKAPDLSGAIEGAGYKRTPTGTQAREVTFSIRALPWSDQTQAAACQVTVVDDGQEWISGPIFGIDPLQAMELSLQLVSKLVSLRTPSP